jgi:voltage-gated potassium channel
MSDETDRRPKVARVAGVPMARHDLAIRRMVGSLFAMMFVAFTGASLYFVLGRGRWSFGECVYMAVITISTVGFGELNRMSEVPGARGVTIGLIAGGIGVIAYFQANLTTLLLEGSVRQVFRRNRMRKEIIALRGHVVVAGAGSTGRHVIDELIATERPFVVIERNREHGERLSEELMNGRMLVVFGDATMDHVLLQAGVDRASGVVAALTHDKDNLFVTLSARSLNATARIVTKVVEEESTAKMLKAGATRVVSPAMIGGRRLASELVRPEVTELLDQMLRDKDKTLRLEEVVLQPGSALADVALKDSPIRRETKALIIAMRGNDGVFSYNPDPTIVMQVGWTLIAIGEAESIRKLRGLAGEERLAEGSASVPPRLSEGSGVARGV